MGRKSEMNKDIDSYKISKGSNIEIWWKCGKVHSSNRSVIGRTGKGGNGCPKCSVSKFLVN